MLGISFDCGKARAESVSSSYPDRGEPDKAGLAAALLNASQQLGGALGLAIFSALATSRTNDLLAAHDAPAHALTAGFQRALLASSIFILAAAVIGLWTTNTRAETQPPLTEAPESAPA